MPAEKPVPASETLPQLAGRPMVTDGGLETDLIFNRGVDLPEFAAFRSSTTRRAAPPRRLLRRVRVHRREGRGRARARVADVAGQPGLGSPGSDARSTTWRGSTPQPSTCCTPCATGMPQTCPTWWSAEWWGRAVTATGATGQTDPGEAAAYHRPQLAAFADAGVDVVTAYTLTDPGEAVGIVLAAPRGRPAGGDLLHGGARRSPARRHPAARGRRRRRRGSAPDYYLVNCAHPHHVLSALDASGRDALALDGSSGCATTRPRAATPSSTTQRTSTPATSTCSPEVTPGSSDAPRAAQRGGRVLRHRRHPRREALGRLRPPRGTRQRSRRRSGRRAGPRSGPARRRVRNGVSVMTRR